MLVVAAPHGDANATTGPGFTPLVLVAGALACTIAEGLPFGNDNLNIPVITAFVVDRFAGNLSADR